MSESRTIDFLYRTVPGRFLLKGLVNPLVSRCGALLLSSRLSVFWIPCFIKTNKIDIDNYEVPEGGYRSFNSFFTRKLKPQKRIIEEGELISPCDGLLTIAPINADSIFPIKNSIYATKNLLRDKHLAEQFVGGTALIFRLTPSHYHRYGFCVSGMLKKRKRIRGKLHSVKPICHEVVPVFIENTREYIVIKNENLGPIVQMEVGALLVGRISNIPVYSNKMIRAGTEKGFFEYGGSSIVVLLRSGIEIDQRIRERIPVNGEIPVRRGEALVGGREKLV